MTAVTDAPAAVEPEHSAAVGEGEHGAANTVVVDFDTDPARYRHWKLDVEGEIATLSLAIDPAGGIVPGYETARHLGAKAIFVEREDGVFKLRRGFSIAPGARVLMVEDIITTGLSSRECLAAIADHPGHLVGAACLIDRSGGRAEIGVDRVALATLDVPSYPADALPPELAAIPAVKPGSRSLTPPAR